MRKEQTNINFKSINAMIECPCCLEKGFENLLQINNEDLSPKLTVRKLYLEGKYYQLKAKISHPVKYLEKANEVFDTIYIFIANHKDLHHTAKYQFKRAWTKYLLSQYLDSPNQNHLLRTVKQITEEVLLSSPENKSFLFLKDKIQP